MDIVLIDCGSKKLPMEARMAFEEIAPYANGITRRMFIETADVNYVSARAAYFDERYQDFWWLTLHAVEKYLKAILLKNGRSSKGYAHDLSRLLPAIRHVDPRLGPPSFSRPKIENLEVWAEPGNTTFITRLNEQGSADNRYGTYGHATRLDDLLRADQLVYWARRFAVPRYRKLQSGEKIDQYTALIENPVFRISLEGKLEALYKLPSRDPKRRPFQRLNAPFFPQMRHRVRGWSHAAVNSPIPPWIYRLEDPANDGVAPKVLQWVLDNIQLNQEDRNELKTLLETHTYKSDKQTKTQQL